MNDLRLFRRVLRDAKPYWLSIFATFLVSLLATPLALLNPVPLQLAVDSVIGSEPLPPVIEWLVPVGLRQSQTGLLFFAAGLVIAVALLARLQNLAHWLLSTHTGERLVLSLQCRLFEHAQRLSLSYHDSIGTADTIYRIQRDATSIRAVALEGINPIVTAAFTLVAMVYVTFRVDWQLALVALTVTPLFTALIVWYRHRLRTSWIQVKDLESAALNVVQEVLTSLRVVKAFAQEKREQDRFRLRYGQGLESRLKAIHLTGSFDLLTGLTVATGTALFLFVGVRHVLEGVLTLGLLLLIMSYLAQLYEPLKSIGKKITDLQNALASAERAYSLLDACPDVPDRPNGRRIDRARGHLAFHGVGSQYESGKPVLQGIDFHVPPGARVGIAGKTGAGKTTLVNLMIRFQDPVVGEIQLDGMDLRDYRLADLRNQFAIVLQDPVLFSTSIAENIAYARPEASTAEIEEAARAANAHEFISQLPHGYQAPVGERGMRLSGGERQRIALARAFLKDAPVLILDEPTSSIDMKTETGIMEAMERLMEGRTTFMIAHRLSTLQSCNMLLILEEGRIVLNTSDVKAALTEVRRSALTREALGA